MGDWSHLDRQLRSTAYIRSGDVPVFRSSTLNHSALASGLASDVRRVLRYARQEWPSIIKELSDPISLQERRDALIGYFHLAQRGDLGDPILQRAKIITQLYFDLVYFRDRIFVLLRSKISQEPHRFGDVSYLSEWLALVGENEFAKRLRALRNGFPHGK